MINGATAPRYPNTNHVLFARDGAVYAVAWDPQNQKLNGSEQQLVSGIVMHANGAAQFDAAGTLLAYVAGGVLTATQELVSVDFAGKAEVLSSARQRFMTPRFSPIGNQIAIMSEQGANTDVWRLDVRRGTMSRVTTDPGEDLSPVWSPDGRTLAIATEVGEKTGEEGPALGKVDATGSTEQLIRSPRFGDWEFPTSWSPDGRWIAYMKNTGGSSRDIWLFPAARGEPKPFLAAPANEWAGMFSPDGRWFAYVSDESGTAEVYVAAFPEGAPRVQVSNSGGTEPLWARDGKALFYRQGTRMMRVNFVRGGIDSASVPEVLFEGRFEAADSMGAETANYDIFPDGKRFVMVRRKGLELPSTISLIFNWRSLLKQ